MIVNLACKTSYAVQAMQTDHNRRCTQSNYKGLQLTHSLYYICTELGTSKATLPSAPFLKSLRTRRPARSMSFWC